MDEIVPADLKDFILRHIDSIAQIEVLLLIREATGEVWDVSRAAHRVYANPAEIEQVLERFADEGFFCRAEGGYLYNPDTANSALIARLATAYAKHLIAITNMIHSKPRRIREFANAFRLRRGT